MEIWRIVLTYADNEDLRIIKENRSTAVYCPVSNAWSGAGRTRVEKWLEEGINTTLRIDFLLSDL
ncbi:MAG: hypothetical protein KAR21_24115 [Spirochaetales bacterium]|nr:hypothetical protein [Spirochaetales bacterium]